MSASFAEAAARWCALAARLLGWRPGEFWSATPAELAMALAAPEDPATPPPPTREMIARMMERDAHD
ncbi:phage tail assembly chaperone [Erythrobacter sp. BLCC-B19]|uniref:phage tail assembly chaperone n=1 Tax=Erythrobacter sp. BLCC-B19 TaxID=3025315 RepID=UPI00235F8EF6|nr:phage tail assembly chaperone [Erythrobacter sp. BLCC-B19]WDA42155.1 phage tail assembly chaperone [Erythrobacter sp. BLCC-B19]